MDRRTALALLGLDDPLDPAVLRARFRELARTHHPDHGGDAAAFRRLQDASALLQAELAGSRRAAPPRVARGRPSRVPATMAATSRAGTLSARAEELVTRLTDRGTCAVVSCAPGSRLNRFAASLTAAATGRLVLRVVPAGPGAPAAVRLTLDGRGRRARRALAAVDPTGVPGATWSRHRGDARTALTATVTATDADEAPAVVARRAVTAAAALLDALGWPLEGWHPEG